MRLTSCEKKVLELIAYGKCNKQIAAHLGVSVSTIQNEAHNLFQKLAVSSRTEAAMKYWLSPNPELDEIIYGQGETD